MKIFPTNRLPASHAESTLKVLEVFFSVSEKTRRLKERKKERNGRTGAYMAKKNHLGGTKVRPESESEGMELQPENETTAATDVATEVVSEEAASEAVSETATEVATKDLPETETPKPESEEMQSFKSATERIRDRLNQYQQKVMDLRIERQRRQEELDAQKRRESAEIDAQIAVAEREAAEIRAKFREEMESVYGIIGVAVTGRQNGHHKAKASKKPASKKRTSEKSTRMLILEALKDGNSKSTSEIRKYFAKYNRTAKTASVELSRLKRDGKIHQPQHGWYQLSG